MRKGERILIVDILRGFALLLIVLIHYVEHFDFFAPPETSFLFSNETDSRVMQLVLMLISGKAYSIFALLFGISFFIQMDRKEQEGIDFRGTFLWRLTVLFLLGFSHSLIYRGDILHIYAIMGLPLLFLHKFKSKTLIWITILLVIQIPFIYQLIGSFLSPEYEIVRRIPDYWYEGEEVYKNGDFLDVIKYNLWKGRVSVWSWIIYNGRFLQLMALFIFGMILGRLRFFENVMKYKWYLNRIVIVGAFLMGILFLISEITIEQDLSELQKNQFLLLFTSFSNLSFTAVLMAIITLLYIKFPKGYLFELFGYYGRMSLTNYVFQAVTGVVLFYGFGFGLYRYVGATWSLLLGFFIFFTQASISYYWSRKYYYGPLEWFWRALTFLNFNIKFKK